MINSCYSLIMNSLDKYLPSQKLFPMNILKAKGRSILLMVYGLPLIIIAYNIIYGLYVFHFVDGQGFFTIPIMLIVVPPITLLVWLITYSIWTYIIGRQLYNYLPEKRPVHFSIFTVTVLSTLLASPALLGIFFYQGISLIQKHPNVIYMFVLVILITFLIQSWLLAKFFRSVELQKNAVSSHFLDYFLTLIILPFGAVLFQKQVRQHFEITEI